MMASAFGRGTPSRLLIEVGKGRITTNGRGKMAEGSKPASEMLLAEISQRIEALDRHGAVALLLAAVERGDISVPDLYMQVLGPVLAEIGTRWQHGRERVWQEHFASHVVRTVVEALYPRVMDLVAAVTPLGKTALLVCPPREEHELGLRMLSDRFELAGWDTVFLGADTPLAEIVAAATDTEADLVALSVSTAFERVEMREFVDAIRRGLPDARIVVGGPAFLHDGGDWSADELLDPAELGLPGSPRTG
jgi:MerR family transcriptional regulator, light-induced transcriptional regulator